MKQKTIFQIVVVSIFFALAGLGVVFFATYRGESSDEEVSAIEFGVVVWGTLDRTVMQDLLNLAKQSYQEFKAVDYIQKDPRTFTSELVNALAAGTGPDLIIIPLDQILSQQDKIIPIPYTTFSERQFKDTFVEEGELLLTNDGMLGMPFILDPLVLYWNRTLFTNNAVANPPEYWDEVFTLAEDVTRRRNDFSIEESAIALGEHTNITNATDIISMLMFQAGTPIIARDSDGGLESVLNQGTGVSGRPAESAVRFYTEFSNPIKSVYSWNRSLPESRQMFLAGDLAMYIGFASEYPELRRANPNLNFDLATVPQSRGASRLATYGDMQIFAIPKVSKNVQGAFGVAYVFTGPQLMARFSEITGLPPVNRLLLGQEQTDAYRAVTYESALISQGFLDPNSNQTDTIFKDMIEEVTSGREQISSAVNEASKRFDEMIR